MKYTIPSEPVPLMRARCGRSRVWDAQKQIKFATACVIKIQHADKPITLNPLHVDLTFFMPLPKKRYKHLIGQYHTPRPDLDNLVKFVLDVCNNIIYHDDAQIVSFTAKKVYDIDARTEFVITELEDGQRDQENQSSNRS
jgi:Holliday junction resolvase RusA-like endonuclease